MGRKAGGKNYSPMLRCDVNRMYEENRDAVRRKMAEQMLSDLEAEARRRWPLAACLIVHRLGRVPPAEASVAIVVSTPHRREAFAAGQWLIDSLKRVVPIWKREQWADGAAEWVHPGTK